MPTTHRCVDHGAFGSCAIFAGPSDIAHTLVENRVTHPFTGARADAARVIAVYLLARRPAETSGASACRHTRRDGTDAPAAASPALHNARVVWGTVNTASCSDEASVAMASPRVACTMLASSTASIHNRTVATRCSDAGALCSFQIAPSLPVASTRAQVENLVTSRATVAFFALANKTLARLANPTATAVLWTR